MARKLVSILGIVTMLIAFSPGLCTLLGASPMTCCNGVLCPMMHRQPDGRVLCGMMVVNLDQPNGAFQPCPCMAHRLAGALPFVRVVPFVPTVKWMVTPFTAPAPPAGCGVLTDVPCPPPRTSTL